MPTWAEIGALHLFRLKIVCKKDLVMDFRRWAGVLLVGFGVIWAQSVALCQWTPPNPVVSFDKTSNGAQIRQKAGVLLLEVDAPDVLHVTYSPLEGKASHPPDHVVVKENWPQAQFDVTGDDKAVTLSTAKLKVVVERESG